MTHFSKADLARGFNEWMRRYTEEPDKFGREFQAVMEFLEQQQDGETPTYGAECAEYIGRLIDEIDETSF